MVGLDSHPRFRAAAIATIASTFALIPVVARSAQNGAAVAATFPQSGQFERVEADAGQPVTLRWDGVSGSALLVGVGPVPARGERVVTPDHEMTYVLVEENAATVNIRSIVVGVRGRKGAGIGNAGFPNDKAFADAPVEGIITGRPFISVVTDVFRFLQDTCRHVVESSHLPWQESEFDLYTNYSEAPDCTGAAPPAEASGRKVRRAFRVRLHKADGGADRTNVQVSAVGQSRRLAEDESKWENLAGDRSFALAAAMKTRLERLR